MSKYLTSHFSSRSRGEKEIKHRGNAMNDNLSLLRQNHCRSVTTSAKNAPVLFPLERECPQGKILLGKVAEALLELEEFDPTGLEQSYRDEACGAQLPVFAIFNLEGIHRFSFEISNESPPRISDRAVSGRTFPSSGPGPS